MEGKMDVRSLNLCSEGDGKQRLVIADVNGGYFIFTLNADQTMLIAQQAMTQIWNYYNLVPRD
jgi:hypothetical protein